MYDICLSAFYHSFLMLDFVQQGGKALVYLTGVTAAFPSQLPAGFDLRAANERGVQIVRENKRNFSAPAVRRQIVELFLHPTAATPVAPAAAPAPPAPTPAHSEMTESGGSALGTTAAAPAPTTEETHAAGGNQFFFICLFIFPSLLSISLSFVCIQYCDVGCFEHILVYSHLLHSQEKSKQLRMPLLPRPRPQQHPRLQSNHRARSFLLRRQSPPLPPFPHPLLLLPHPRKRPPLRPRPHPHPHPRRL